MSALNNLPGLDAVVDRALEVAAEKEKVDKHDEALSAHLWLWNTAQTLPPTSHIYWKSAAALMRFEARLGGPEFPLGIWLDEHLRRVVCKRARNILDNAKFPKVRQKLQKVFGVYHVLIPQASMELVEDGFKWQPYGNLRAFVSATGTEASDIFNRTGLHHAVRSTSASANYHSWEAIPDLCQLWVRGDKWANRLSSQAPERWNPIGWEEDFTEAIADPTKWLRRLQRKKQGVDPNARDLDHWAPLHHCCYTVLPGQDIVGGEAVRKALTDMYHSRATSWAQLLIKLGADVNARGLDGMTPLHCAAISGNSELVKLLIENNAQVAAEDARGIEPFHLAAMGDVPSVFGQFCKSPGFEFPDVRDRYLRTPMHFAAFSGAKKSLLRLKDLRADLNSRDDENRTPLHFAAQSVATKSIHELCKLGAKLNLKDNEGLTPLAILFTSDDKSNPTEDTKQAAFELVARGTSVDIEDNKGRNLLHHAAMNGHVQLAIALINNAKRLREMAQKQDSDGRTPRILLRSQGGKLDETWKQLEETIEADENAGGHGTAMQCSTTDEEAEALAFSSRNGSSCWTRHMAQKAFGWEYCYIVARCRPQRQHRSRVLIVGGMK